MKQEFYDAIVDNPVIAAVKSVSDLETCCSLEEIRVVFILFGDVCSIDEIVKKVKDAGKVAMVHMDLVNGLSSKEIAVDFIKNHTQADGIITTKQTLIKRAKELDLYTVLRYFVLDSMALENIRQQQYTVRPDLIEVLPGVMPKVIARICQSVKTPVIAGGLIIDKEDVMNALDAGVSGAATARELARYDLKICVIEKEEDVCCGTSKANSAIVHAGYDAAEGSLMAKLNVRGNELMEQLSEKLDFPFKRTGSLVICRSEEGIPELEKLYRRGKANGVKGLQILNREEVLEMEPGITEDVCAALYAPTAGIVCPFHLNIALAENANENGVEFKFNTEAETIRKSKEGWSIKTNQGVLETKCIVNAAGVYADRFHNMVSEKKIHITPRKGEYCLLDKTAGNLVSRTIFALPDQYGKGVLVTPTVHGNLLIGPTANDIEDKEGTNTTREGLDEVLRKAGMSVKQIPVRQVITSFAGLRAHEDGHEFIIEEVKGAEGFIDCAGIESPGLTSCPAIGEMAAELVCRRLKPEKKKVFQAVRKGILNPEKLSKEEYAELIRQKPAYGNIICRCEKVTEGEILDAIHRPLGARSLDGVKRRTRAGMGRCQAGFCSPRTMEILAREWGVSMEEITKSGKGSEIIVGINKDSYEGGEQHE